MTMKGVEMKRVLRMTNQMRRKKIKIRITL
jgi:hypothetical protein